MRHLAGLALFIALSAIHPEGVAAKAPLNIVVSCRANPQCVFNGEDIYLDVVIENNSDKNVFLTTKFMRGTGAYIKVIDNKTKKMNYSFASLGDYALLGEYQLVKAKSRITLKTEVISAYELTLQRASFVDARLEVNFLGKWKFVHGEAVPFDEVGNVHIIGADTLARRNP